MDVVTLALAKKYADDKVSDKTLSSAVEKWLDEHPEATTTVGDRSITEQHLSDDVFGIFADSQNLFNTIALFPNMFIVTTTGEENTTLEGIENYVSTDFLELDGTIYKLLNSNMEYVNFFGGAYYNEDKTFKSRIYGVEKIQAPDSSAKYVRLTFNLTTTNVLERGKFFFGAIDDCEERIERGTVNLKEINANKFSRVEATELSDDVYFSRNLKEKLFSNENLAYSLLQNNTINLLDESKLLLNKTIDTSSGVITDIATNVGVIDCNMIKPNTDYYITTGIAYIYYAWWLDEQGKPICNANILNANKFYTSPDGAYGIRVLTNYSSRVDSPTTGELMICEGAYEQEYVAHEEDYKIKPSYLPGAKGNKDWSLYNYYAIGDSRTAGNNLNPDGTYDGQLIQPYPKQIEHYTGINCVNGGMSGAAFCYREGLTEKTMYEQAAEVPLDTDIVTVFGGTNDRILGVLDESLCPYGNARDNSDDKYDVTTFKGAVRQTIKNIKLRCPFAVIIFLVETRNGLNGEATAGLPETAKDGGQTIKDMIEEICEQHKIPVLDLNKCAMTGRESDEYMADAHKPFSDSLHESAYGQRFMALAVAGEMSKYLW